MAKKEKIVITPEMMPRHIALILDGNGRWAKKHLVPRSAGHAAGAKNMKEMITYCKDVLHLEYLSLYCFSTENWSRSQEEVSALMKIFNQYLDDYLSKHSDNVRVIFMGDKSKFDPSLQEKMLEMEQKLANNKGTTVFIGMNYGGRDEIVRASRVLADQVKNGELNSSDITEELFEQQLYTQDAPPVDLMIRPSGELRISNFMLWQCAYAEFYFPNILWPDFSPSDMDDAIIEFAKRNRRFGGR